MNFIEAVKAYKDGNVVIRRVWPRSETNGSGEECVYFWALSWDNGMRSVKYVRRGNRYERASDTARDPIFPSEILENDWVVWDWANWKEPVWYGDFSTPYCPRGSIPRGSML